MHPVLALTLGMVGAAALVRWCVREVGRVTSELDGIRNHRGLEPVDRNALPKLKRDPATGEYRPS
jgi:hypothetical protein